LVSVTLGGIYTVIIFIQTPNAVFSYTFMRGLAESRINQRVAQVREQSVADKSSD
jgi:hypothetical protein